MNPGTKRKCEMVIDSVNDDDKSMADAAAYILSEVDPNRDVMETFLDKLEVYSETVYIELLSHCVERQGKLDDTEDDATDDYPT